MDYKEVKDMLRLQKNLNDNTNGITWIFGLNNKYGNSINWLRCVHMEIAELIDSSPWKHWKDLSAKTDVENQKVEITDVLHFLLSYHIHTQFLKHLNLILNFAERKIINKRKKEFYNESLSKKEILKLAKNFDGSYEKELAKELSTQKEYSLIKFLTGESTILEKEIYEEVYNDIEESIVHSFLKAYGEDTSYNLYHKEISINEKSEILSSYAMEGSILEIECYNTLKEVLQKEMVLNKILPIFRDIEESLDFNTVGYYFGKNALNQFRQDNGYKEGTYKKIWKGKEDNVVMIEIISTIENPTLEKIYSELEKAYKLI